MRYLRFVAAVLVGAIVVGVAGCAPTVNSQSRGDYGTVPPPREMPREQPRQGMSTRNKVLMLAGAAALYYMYQKNKNKSEREYGAEGKYYRSKNGRIYYRDKKGVAHWVTPPQQPIQVPADEYERYTGRRVDDYDGRVLREAPAGWN